MLHHVHGLALLPCLAPVGRCSAALSAYPCLAAQALECLQCAELQGMSGRGASDLKGFCACS